jgi:hypothetical protein
MLLYNAKKGEQGFYAGMRALVGVSFKRILGHALSILDWNKPHQHGR